jgi:Mn2+/Fe2+ NRAMP family transporter
LLVVPAAILILVLQIFMSYGVIFKVFKWLTVALFAYVITGFLVHPDIRQLVVSSLVPRLELTNDSIAALVAIFGTTISPYLFFWQASSEVDEMRAAGKVTESARRGVRRSELRAARTDIVIGMLFSNLVMYFIILTTAAVLHAHGRAAIQTAGQAAEALAPLAGQWAFVLFAAGMIGTGLLAVPILTASAAYAVKEFLGFEGALADKVWYRPTFYAIMAVSTIAAVGMNLLAIDPIRALFVTAIINGVVAPPLLVLIVLLGSDRGIMKERVSGWVSRSLTWTATAVMSTAAVALLVTLIRR